MKHCQLCYAEVERRYDYPAYHERGGILLLRVCEPCLLFAHRRNQDALRAQGIGIFASTQPGGLS